MTTDLFASVDRSACAGHGRCYDLAPEVFEPDDEGFALVVANPVAGDQEDAARSAQNNCPERAVTLSADAQEENAE